MVEELKTKTIRNNFKCQFCYYSTIKKKKLAHTYIKKSLFGEQGATKKHQYKYCL